MGKEGYNSEMVIHKFTNVKIVLRGWSIYGCHAELGE